MPTIFKDYENRQKKAIDEAESGAPAAAPAPTSGKRFEKPFTPEERKKQQAALAAALRKRDAEFSQ